MVLPGDRPWDAQLKGHLFLILSGWFARISRSMDTRCSYSFVVRMYSPLMQRTSNAFYFFCWPFFVFVILTQPKPHKLLGFWTWTSVSVCVHICMHALVCLWTSTCFYQILKVLLIWKDECKEIVLKMIFTTLVHIFTSRFLYGELHLGAGGACEHKWNTAHVTTHNLVRLLLFGGN